MHESTPPSHALPLSAHRIHADPRSPFPAPHKSSATPPCESHLSLLEQTVRTTRTPAGLERLGDAYLARTLGIRSDNLSRAILSYRLALRHVLHNSLRRVRAGLDVEGEDEEEEEEEVVDVDNNGDVEYDHRDGSDRSATPSPARLSRHPSREHPSTSVDDMPSATNSSGRTVRKGSTATPQAARLCVKLAQSLHERTILKFGTHPNARRCLHAALAHADAAIAAYAAHPHWVARQNTTSSSSSSFTLGGDGGGGNGADNNTDSELARVYLRAWATRGLLYEALYRTYDDDGAPLKTAAAVAAAATAGRHSPRARTRTHRDGDVGASHETRHGVAPRLAAARLPAARRARQQARRPPPPPLSIPRGGESSTSPSPSCSAAGGGGKSTSASPPSLPCPATAMQRAALAAVPPTPSLPPPRVNFHGDAKVGLMLRAVPRTPPSTPLGRAASRSFSVQSLTALGAAASGAMGNGALDGAGGAGRDGGLAVGAPPDVGIVRATDVRSLKRRSYVDRCVAALEVALEGARALRSAACMLAAPLGATRGVTTAAAAAAARKREVAPAGLAAAAARKGGMSGFGLLLVDARDIVVLDGVGGAALGARERLRALVALAMAYCEVHDGRDAVALQKGRKCIAQIDAVLEDVGGGCGFEGEVGELRRVKESIEDFLEEKSQTERGPCIICCGGRGMGGWEVVQRAFGSCSGVS